MSEIELKFLVDKEAAITLRSVLHKRSAKGEKPRTQRLRSIYFDTPDLALHKSGFSIRLRRENSGWTQTVKTRSPVRAGLSEVGEFECRVPKEAFDIDAIPDECARRQVGSLIGAARLEPVCETLIDRTSGIVARGRKTRAELCIDDGRVVAGKRRARLREVEIELITGNVAELYRLARELLVGLDFRFSRLSKSDRGYLLAAEGRSDNGSRPRNSATVPLAGGQTIAEARRAIYYECLDQITANIDSLRNTADPEAPHQLRIGLRRTRAALMIFEPVAPGGEIRRLGREVRWLGRKVGALRDRDVAVIDIVDPHARSHPQEKGTPALRKSLVREARTTRRKVRKVLGGKRAQRLLFDIARFAEGAAASRKRSEPGIERLFADVLDRCWKPVRRRGRVIDHLSVRQRHRLRKDLKQLRYVAEFSAPLFAGGRYDNFLAALKRLQNVFGALNDVAMMSGILAGDALGGGRKGGARKAGGRIVARRDEQSRRDWKKAVALWKQLKKGGPYWR